MPEFQLYKASTGWLIRHWISDAKFVVLASNFPTLTAAESYLRFLKKYRKG